MSLTYSFDHPHEPEPRTLTGLLGGKGANLAQMVTRLGLPVPPGFTITTEAWRTFDEGGWPDGLDDELGSQVARLETKLSRGFGDVTAPLLVSVRSGAAVSMPGMMDTVLNLGFTEQTLVGLADRGGEAFALDTYLRFLRLYADVVLGVPSHVLALTGETSMSGRAACDRILDVVEAHTGVPFPHDPWIQLRQAVEAVFRSWHGAKARSYRAHEGLPDDAGTAVTVQAMVFGTQDARSATGVVFTRDPSTGERGRFGDLLFEAQGEDVVSGAFVTQPIAALRDRLPAVATELEDILECLETHYRDMCDVEFTIESGRLWVLQTRVGKRSPRAAVRMAVEMTRQPGWKITRDEALARVDELVLVQVATSTTVGDPVPPIAIGVGASPGTATGHAYFDADACLDAADRGEPVVLVRAETSPEDVHGMQVAEGILTTHGGLVSHAAVVARAWGVPAVVSLEGGVIDSERLVIGEAVIRQGDVITLDGGSGRVYLGAAALVAGEAPFGLEELLSWRASLDAES